MRSLCRPLVALLALTLVPTAAFAQNKEPSEAPVPEGPVLVVPVYEAPTPAPVAAAPAPVAPPAPPPYVERRGPRMRLALEAGVGGASGDTEGGALNLNVQIGYQGSDLWAVYYQTGLALNGWAAGDDAIEAYAFSPQLAMFDLTLGRMFQIGAGVGVDVGSFGVCVEDQCTMTDTETQPASEARVAVIIPLGGVRARWGIPLSLRFHSTYFEDSTMHTVTFNAGIMRF